jgi:hypothetical protein
MATAENPSRYEWLRTATAISGPSLTTRQLLRRCGFRADPRHSAPKPKPRRSASAEFAQRSRGALWRVGLAGDSIDLIAVPVGCDAAPAAHFALLDRPRYRGRSPWFISKAMPDGTLEPRARLAQMGRRY